ncbi:hypothetical protein TRFO_09793 [Tritrichomonas foetus]|uniref:Ribonuclease H2 subunit B n=1 Tax=Tritrichomonas foetus TaxID=1144522 RepID=A0A1J4JEZ2_9EUKA|nr:hypothetical protein TRFO_09793 [Tritrichomonas foetus]|eukprot:OHS96871.1 hypothetical protein TRFO_09793 [Tritrichomonas foetus]
MQVAVLPSGFLENSEYFTFPHPRNGKPATFIRHNNKIYELFHVDRPHSSWFVGNSVISNGTPLYSVEIHPLFIVLPFMASRGKQMFTQNDFFFDTPYSVISDQLNPYLQQVCQTMELGDDIQFNYDPKKAVQWLVGKTEKLMPFVKESNDPSMADHFLIEMCFDIIRHYISKEIANDLKEILHDKYPGSFPPKRNDDPQPIVDTKKGNTANANKKKAPASKLKKPEGNMSISSFFSPVKSKK